MNTPNVTYRSVGYHLPFCHRHTRIVVVAYRIEGGPAAPLRKK